MITESFHLMLKTLLQKINKIKKKSPPPSELLLGYSQMTQIFRVKFSFA